MATVNCSKIVDVASVAPGDIHHITWYPPWNVGLSFFAFADPPSPSGEHGTSTGSVEIVRITSKHVKRNGTDDTKQVDIYVQNIGTTPTGFNLWETWVTP